MRIGIVFIISFFAVLLFVGCSQSEVRPDSTLTSVKELDISTGISYKSGSPAGLSVSIFLKDDKGNSIPFADELIDVEITLNDLEGKTVYAGTKQVSSALELMDDLVIPFNEIDVPNPMSRKHLSSVRITLPDGTIISGSEKESSQPVI